MPSPRPWSKRCSVSRRSETEIQLIAVQLAVRRGLERLYPIDDQSATDLMIEIFDTLAVALEVDPEVVERLGHRDFAPLSPAVDRRDTPQRALAAILELNEPAIGIFDAHTHWLIVLDRELPQSSGRVRMAKWEARNLKMAANIRTAYATVSGGRVLVVVGASHEPWLDAYFDLMTGREVVDAVAVLWRRSPGRTAG